MHNYEINIYVSYRSSFNSKAISGKKENYFQTTVVDVHM